MTSDRRYRAAWWLPGGHAQTVWGKFARRRPDLALTREVFDTPDGDQLETFTLAAAPGAARLLFLHGLEGTLDSHYVGGMMRAAVSHGFSPTLMMFRGCGSVPNRARRFYHSGETTDAAFIYQSLRARSGDVPWFAIGVSLGGNVLLKWLGEMGESATLTAAAAISVPFDLEAGALAISRGFSRIYDQNFLRTLKAKALRKLVTYPDLFDRSALERTRNVFEFDDAVTAPVHGFSSAHDYYSRSSSLGFLSRIRVPTLLLSACDDPFLPRPVLDAAAARARENPALTTEFVGHGGHVGFVTGAWPWSAGYWAEQRVARFLAATGGRGGRAALP